MATRSFYAVYRAKRGTLLGGVTSGQSSRFQCEADAQTRLETTTELNGENCVGEVVESEQPPEIFRHCHPSISQTIGGKCFRCGKVLTKDDAKESEPVFA